MNVMLFIFVLNSCVAVSEARSGCCIRRRVEARLQQSASFQVWRVCLLGVLLWRLKFGGWEYCWADEFLSTCKACRPCICDRAAKPAVLFEHVQNPLLTALEKRLKCVTAITSNGASKPKAMEKEELLSWQVKGFAWAGGMARTSLGNGTPCTILPYLC